MKVGKIGNDGMPNWIKEVKLRSLNGVLEKQGVRIEADGEVTLLSEFKGQVDVINQRIAQLLLVMQD